MARRALSLPVASMHRARGAQGPAQGRPRPRAERETVLDPARLRKREHFLRARHLYAVAALTGLPFFGRALVRASNKATIRLAPSIKNYICGRCHAVLVPGRNCAVRVYKGTAVMHCGCGCPNKMPRVLTY